MLLTHKLIAPAKALLFSIFDASVMIVVCRGDRITPEEETKKLSDYYPSNFLQGKAYHVDRTVPASAC